MSTGTGPPPAGPLPEPCSAVLSATSPAVALREPPSEPRPGESADRHSAPQEMTNYSAPKTITARRSTSSADQLPLAALFLGRGIRFLQALMPDRRSSH